MSKSNIWINKQYKEKVEKLLEDKNIFEVSKFFESHQFRDSEQQTEYNTQDHDITIVDEITFDVFVDHLNCYFSD